VVVGVAVLVRGAGAGEETVVVEQPVAFTCGTARR
jgi:hypothetical protein